MPPRRSTRIAAADPPSQASGSQIGEASAANSAAVNPDPSVTTASSKVQLPGREQPAPEPSTSQTQFNSTETVPPAPLTEAPSNDRSLRKRPAKKTQSESQPKAPAVSTTKKRTLRSRPIHTRRSETTSKQSDSSDSPDHSSDPEAQPSSSDSESGENSAVEEDPSHHKKRRIAHSPAKRRSSGTITQPAQSSTHKDDSPPGNQSPDKNAVRSQALKRFETALKLIFSDGNEEAAQSQSATYTQALEAGIWNSFSESIGGKKGVGKAYRERFRTLLFSLNDKTNDTLRSRIKFGELSPTELATMPNDQLANDALRAKVEAARRNAVQQSILKPQTGPLRKITHKGEEYIEFDPGAIENPLRKQDQDKDDAGHQAYLVQLEREKEQDVHTSAVSTSEPSRSAEAGPSMPPRATANRARSSPPRADSKPGNNFDLLDAIGQGEPEQELGNFELEGPGQGSSEGVNADAIMDALDEPDEEYNPFFDAGAASAPPAPTDASPTNDQVGEEEELYDPFADADDPVSPKAPFPTDVVWKGAVTMPGTATFSGEARQVGGYVLADLGTDIWDTFFPVQHSVLKNRLASDVAEAYLEQCIVAPALHVAVWTINPVFDAQALLAPATDAQLEDLHPPSTQEENATLFQVLMDYFMGKGRYGVWSAHPADKNLAVKDFYVGGLRAHGPWPAWLQKLAPAGLDHADHDRLVLVAVINKVSMHDGLAQRRASSSTPSGITPIPPISTPRTGHTPPLSSAPPGPPPVAPGTGSLQNLLGQLRTPAVASNSPQPGAPTLEAALEQLARMPRAEAEAFLFANPALLDQLTNVTGPTSAPPGPPPVRPATPASSSPYAPGTPPVGPPSAPPPPPNYGYQTAAPDAYTPYAPPANRWDQPRRERAPPQDASYDPSGYDPVSSSSYGRGRGWGGRP